MSSLKDSHIKDLKDWRTHLRNRKLNIENRKIWGKKTKNIDVSECLLRLGVLRVFVFVRMYVCLFVLLCVFVFVRAILLWCP